MNIGPFMSFTHVPLSLLQFVILKHKNVIFWTFASFCGFP